MNTEYLPISFFFIFRFLLAQLSLNLKPLWESSFKVIETYAGENVIEGFWSVWFEMFKNVNSKAANQDSTKKEGVDFANFRNQLLQVLIVCPNICKMAEKNNAEICHQFLEVFQKGESQSVKGDGLLAFLQVFAKFKNLQSMSAYSKIKHFAQNGLGHLQEKIRETAVAFFTSAHKELRPHKVNFPFI